MTQLYAITPHLVSENGIIPVSEPVEFRATQIEADRRADQLGEDHPTRLYIVSQLASGVHGRALNPEQIQSIIHKQLTGA